jgi:predicted Fe-S protein YdhL (DUF1289 family)
VIASPCINVCRMDPRSGYCEGCFRTLAEIAAWGGAPDAEKRATLDRVAERAAAADLFEEDLRGECER